MLTSCLIYSVLLQTQKPTIPNGFTTAFGKKVVFTENKATVLVFLEPACPITQEYQPTFKRIHQNYQNKNVEFIGVLVDPRTKNTTVKELNEKYSTSFAYFVDKKHTFVKSLGAKISPEAIVLNQKKQVVYQGRIDDTYPRIGIKKKPKTHELSDAIDATLAGKKPKVSKTQAIGCIIPDLKDFDGMSFSKLVE